LDSESETINPVRLDQISSPISTFFDGSHRNSRWQRADPYLGRVRVTQFWFIRQSIPEFHHIPENLSRRRVVPLETDKNPGPRVPLDSRPWIDEKGSIYRSTQSPQEQEV
jgi:hypothetical protein